MIKDIILTRLCHLLWAQFPEKFRDILLTENSVVMVVYEYDVEVGEYVVNTPNGKRHCYNTTTKITNFMYATFINADNRDVISIINYDDLLCDPVLLEQFDIADPRFTVEAIARYFTEKAKRLIRKLVSLKGRYSPDVVAAELTKRHRFYLDD